MRSCGSVRESDGLQPLAIGDCHAVGAEVKFSLKIKRKQLRPLRLNNGAILLSDAILKGDQFFWWNVVAIVQAHD